MNKKLNGGGVAALPPPARQTLVNQRLWPDEGLDEDTVDDVDTQEEDSEHYATLSDQNHYSTLRKTPSGSRYQRNARTAQMSHFSQFSRLPPVPERPSLESRELSPVPDIVSPSNPILTSHHNQNSTPRPGQSVKSNNVKIIRFEIFLFRRVSLVRPEGHRVPRVSGDDGGSQHQHAREEEEPDPHG